MSGAKREIASAAAFAKLGVDAFPDQAREENDCKLK